MVLEASLKSKITMETTVINNAQPTVYVTGPSWGIPPCGSMHTRWWVLVNFFFSTLLT